MAIRLSVLFLLSILTCFPQTFPTGPATDADLLVARYRAQAALAANIDASATSFTVSSISKFTNNMGLVIDDESIFCSTFSGLTFSGCTRGFDSTTATSHTGGTLVSGYLIPCHHNCLATEIKALETYLAVSTNSALPANALVYCSDCTETISCGGGGSGAWARCRAGSCECFWGATAIGRGWTPIEIGRPLSGTSEEDFSLPAGECSAVKWIIRGLSFSSSPTNVFLRVATGGSFHTGSVYRHATRVFESNGSTGSIRSGASPDIWIQFSRDIGDGSGEGLSGEIILFDPSNTTDYKTFAIETSHQTGTTTVNMNFNWGMGTYQGGVPAISDVRFLYTDAALSAVNASGGVIDFYGLDCD